MREIGFDQAFCQLIPFCKISRIHLISLQFRIQGWQIVGKVQNLRAVKSVWSGDTYLFSIAAIEGLYVLLKNIAIKAQHSRHNLHAERHHTHVMMAVLILV